MPPIANCQPLHRVPDPPPSGASSLPHLIFGGARIETVNSVRCAAPPLAFVGWNPGLDNTSISVGGGLLPIAKYQPLHRVPDPPPSGASSLPHLIFGGARIETVNSVRCAAPPLAFGWNPGLDNTSISVGGGLPPIAKCQPLHRETDPPLSGASSLPHLIFGGARIETVNSVPCAAPPLAFGWNPGLDNTSINVGGGLPPMTKCQPLHRETDPPPSGASSLPHLIFGGARIETVNSARCAAPPNPGLDNTSISVGGACPR